MYQELHSEFFSYWEAKTKKANQKFSNRDLSGALSIYIDLLHDCERFSGSFRAHEWEGLSTEQTIQIIECLCITSENIAEVYKEEHQVTKEIEVLMRLLQTITDLYFFKAAPLEIKFALKSILERSYMNYNLTISNVEPKFIKRIGDRINFDSKLVNHLATPRSVVQ